MHSVCLLGCSWSEGGNLGEGGRAREEGGREGGRVEESGGQRGKRESRKGGKEREKERARGERERKREKARDREGDILERMSCKMLIG